jgi:hypothetical protein
MATATETARKYATLQDAMAEYARENGDGFSGRDWVGANDYCEEGFRLGEQAHDMPAEDRDDWIESQTYAFPAGDRYLIAVAADYRLAEMVAADAYPFNAEMAA